MEVDIHIIVTDFEDSVLRVSTAVFGRQYVHQGCFFNLTQSTYRKLQDQGLQLQYKDNEDLRLFCDMMDGLAFLPLENDLVGMAYLRTCTPPEAEDLLDYFNSTYDTGTSRQALN